MSDERPTPIEISDEIVGEYQGAYPAELSEGIAEAIEAERAEADRRVEAFKARVRKAIDRHSYTSPHGEPDSVDVWDLLVELGMESEET